MIKEDNYLYCSSEDELFNVKLNPSPVSVRCGLESKLYILVFTSTEIQLKNIDDHKLLFTWSYISIRNYGYCNNKFNFEAGRNCKSGPGIFVFDHSNELKIVQCLARKINLMKEKIRRNETTHSPRDVISIETSYCDHQSTISDQPPHIRAINKNTTDKYVLLTLGNKKSTNTSNIVKATNSKPGKIQDYDKIMARNEARRTEGVHSPDHTKQIDEEEDVDVFGENDKYKQNTHTKSFATQKIMHNIIEDVYYDKINFSDNSESSSHEYAEVECFSDENETLNSNEVVNQYFHNEEPLY